MACVCLVATLSEWMLKLRLGQLSAAARSARMPPPPDRLVGALHDPVGREVGRIRRALTARVQLIGGEWNECHSQGG